MNTLSIDALWQPPGYWVGKYTPWHTTKPKTVTDARGVPVRYPTADKARIAAGEALLAELNRIEVMRFDESQVKETPMVFQARSAAGRRRVAEQRLKEVMREAAE